MSLRTAVAVVLDGLLLASAGAPAGECASTLGLDASCATERKRKAFYGRMVHSTIIQRTFLCLSLPIWRTLVGPPHPHGHPLDTAPHAVRADAVMACIPPPPGALTARLAVL